MTENTPETAQDDTQAPEVPQDDTQAPDAAQDTQEVDQDEGHPSREAAKYRRRLRDTEAERDALATRLEALQRAEAERIAADTVQNPAAIWAAGTDIADVLDEDGNVDPEKVKAATNAAAESLGLAHRRRAPRPNPAQREPEAIPKRLDDMTAAILGRRP